MEKIHTRCCGNRSGADIALRCLVLGGSHAGRYLFPSAGGRAFQRGRFRQNEGGDSFHRFCFFPFFVCFESSICFFCIRYIFCFDFLGSRIFWQSRLHRGKSFIEIPIVFRFIGFFCGSRSPRIL